MADKYIAEGITSLGITFNILRPNSKVNREARFIYTKRFTEALKGGFLTKKKLEAILKGDAGGVDVLANHVSRRAEILKQYADILNAAELSEVPEELDMYSDMLVIYRNQLMEEDISINSLFQNTAEQIADDDEVCFLASELTVDSKGKKVWESLEELMSDERSELVEAVKYQIMCFKYGINSKETYSGAESKFKEKANSLRSAIAASLEEVPTERKKGPPTPRKKKPSPSKEKKAKTKAV